MIESYVQHFSCIKCNIAEHVTADAVAGLQGDSFTVGGNIRFSFIS